MCTRVSPPRGQPAPHGHSSLLSAFVPTHNTDCALWRAWIIRAFVYLPPLCLRASEQPSRTAAERGHVTFCRSAHARRCHPTPCAPAAETASSADPFRSRHQTVPKHRSQPSLMQCLMQCICHLRRRPSSMDRPSPTESSNDGLVVEPGKPSSLGGRLARGRRWSRLRRGVGLR